MNPFNESSVVWIEQPFQTFVNPQNLEIDYNYLNQYKSQLIVINFSSEHWNGFEDRVYKALDETDLNFLILTYDYTSHQRYPRMLYFPYWYYWSRQNFSHINNTFSDKKYQLGCLNGNPRPHRILNFLKLKEKSYWDKSSVSFFKIPGENFSKRDDDIFLTTDELFSWDQLRNDLPDRNVSDLSLLLPQLTDCYLHLVTETTATSKIFISEKTWKAVATGVPFVMWGDAGAMNFLKSQGVDVYDDFIDHKYYDTEVDARLRLDKLYQIIDNLMVQDVEQLYNCLIPRMISNQTQFLNGSFDQNHLDTIITKIKQYN